MQRNLPSSTCTLKPKALWPARRQEQRRKIYLCQARLLTDGGCTRQPPCSCTQQGAYIHCRLLCCASSAKTFGQKPQQAFQRSEWDQDGCVVAAAQFRLAGTSVGSHQLHSEQAAAFCMYNSDSWVPFLVPQLISAAAAAYFMCLSRNARPASKVVLAADATLVSDESPRREKPCACLG
jgi:hypothetical protein